MERDEEQRDQIKALWWDGASLVLAHNRLEHGRFVWPSVRHDMIRLRRTEFAALFAGRDWRRMSDPRVPTQVAAEGLRRIATLIETAKMNGVESYTYLKATFELIAAGHPASKIDELLPGLIAPLPPDPIPPRRHLGPA